MFTETTIAAGTVAVSGLLIIGLLIGAQLIALFKPRDGWTIEHIYGGDPENTDPRAYFAFNQGLAWADMLILAPIQITGSIGMLVGERWGFMLGLMGIVWGLFPAFGVTEMFYCLTRLLIE